MYRQAILLDLDSGNPSYLKDGLTNLGAILLMWKKPSPSSWSGSHKERATQGSRDGSSSDLKFFELAKFYIDTLKSCDRSSIDLECSISVLSFLTHMTESAVSGDAINLLKRINAASASSSSTTFHAHSKDVGFSTDDTDSDVEATVVVEAAPVAVNTSSDSVTKANSGSLASASKSKKSPFRSLDQVGDSPTSSIVSTLSASTNSIPNQSSSSSSIKKEKRKSDGRNKKASHERKESVEMKLRGSPKASPKMSPRERHGNGNSSYRHHSSKSSVESDDEWSESYPPLRSTSIEVGAGGVAAGMSPRSRAFSLSSLAKKFAGVFSKGNKSPRSQNTMKYARSVVVRWSIADANALS